MILWEGKKERFLIRSKEGMILWEGKKQWFHDNENINIAFIRRKKRMILWEGKKGMILWIGR